MAMTNDEILADLRDASLQYRDGAQVITMRRETYSVLAHLLDKAMAVMGESLLASAVRPS